MNLLIVTEHFLRGGLETHISGQVRQLARLGHRVHVACGNRLDADPFEGAAASLSGGMPLGAAERVAGLVSAIDGLAGLIERHAIDVVHAHPFASLLPAWFAAQRAGKPFVLTLHGPLSAQASYGPLHEALLYGLILPRAAQVIGVSDEVRLRVQAHVANDRCVVLPNAVDVERFAPQAVAASARWLLASRLDEDKMPGILRFVDMAAQAGLPGLAIAGDGDAADRLDACLARHGFADGVERLGHRDDLHRLMPRFAGVAGMGRVVLEAAAAGRPVLLLGYDGPKGLVDADLFEIASRTNFSGRGLPAIDGAALRAALQALERRPSAFSLRDKVRERHAGPAVWSRYLELAARWRFEPDPLSQDIDALLQSLHDSELPYLADRGVRGELERLLLSQRYRHSTMTAAFGAAQLREDAAARAEAGAAMQRIEALHAGQQHLAQALPPGSTARDERLRDLEQRLAEREQALAQANAREEAQGTRIESLDRALADSLRSLAEFTQDLQRRDEHLLAQQARLSELEQRSADLRERCAETQRLLAESRAQGTALQRVVDELRPSLAERERELSELREAGAAHARQSADLLQQVWERDARITDLQAREALRLRQEQELQAELAQSQRQADEATQAAAEARQVATEMMHAAAEAQRSAAEAQQVSAAATQAVADGERRAVELDRRNVQAELRATEASAVAQSARQEADLLFRRIETLMASRSWRMTRPLRVLARIVRYRGLPLQDRDALFRMVRNAAGRLPLPAGFKTRARSSLLRWLYGQPMAFFTESGTAVAVLPDALQAPADAPPRAAPSTAGSTGMRASCCGLRPGLVSVVLPVYNQADLLGASIDSVLAQTYRDFELIVVNDGSTDDVERVLAAYAGHPRVRILHQSNQRLPKALSNGFAFASGEFWTWTSADNLMAPQQLEKLAAALQARPEAGMVYADYLAIDDRGEPLRDAGWRAHNRPDPASAEIRLPRSTAALNTVQDNFIGPCFMYRGWIGRLIGDYDPQLGIEDYDYWMRVNRLFSIEHLGSDDLLYRYRVHDNSLSSRHVEHRILDKAQNLMRYERTRAEFYAQDTTFFADPAAAAWLSAQGVAAPPCVVVIDDGAWPAPDAAPPRKQALVLSSAMAMDFDRAGLPPGLPLVLLFEHDDDSPYELARLLARPDVLCVARDARTAARIRLVGGDCPVIDGGAAQARAALPAFVSARVFLRRTRTEQELARVLPDDAPGDQRRNIVLQVDSFTQGGMENVVIDVAHSLLACGHLPRILVLGRAGEAAEKARRAGIEVLVHETGLSPSRYRCLLLELGVKLVNAHYSTFGAEIADLLGVPFVQTIHNSYVWFDPAMVERYRAAQRHTSAYICVSRSAARYADVVLGLDAARMTVIPNGIDTQALARSVGRLPARRRLREQWQAGDAEPVFLNVASIMAPKAQLPLVNAFSRVAGHVPGARLVLLGATMEPQYAAALEKRIHELGLQHKVVMAGYSREVGDFYEAADVFVLPSFWEGWSLSLGEALYLGMPVVATDVGAAGEFADVPNVEIVGMPFGRGTDLNYLNLGRVLYERGPHDERFEGELAQAMLRAARLGRIEPDAAFRERLDAARAYRCYRRVFSRVVPLGAGAAPFLGEAA